MVYTIYLYDDGVVNTIIEVVCINLFIHNFIYIIQKSFTGIVKMPPKSLVQSSLAISPFQINVIEQICHTNMCSEAPDEENKQAGNDRILRSFAFIFSECGQRRILESALGNFARYLLHSIPHISMQI